ncbi:class III lanthionine synthetase LanKC [Secundilactobacillus paracollinoides]|uniref:class III lanthionine synthetase LanKC n=2 Tax=Secundilactobacillus paracollinoides TaxID=240427 RepID=UPI0009F3908A|nr:class III lanthionine synthetase LanKC [Secundilactobacillus paracollinoides]
MMDIRYTDFLNKGTIFYSPTQHESKPYDAPEVELDDWIISSDKDWKYYINRTNSLAKQGWKIHITSTLGESQNCLNVVSSWLIANQISFKYVPNVLNLLSKNSKYGDRASAGKFITVYPKNTQEFCSALKGLADCTSGFAAGPYILNDKQWFDSNVFFRYGAFQEMYAFEDGRKVLGIENSKGVMVPDIRAPYYVVPDFVEEPGIVVQMTAIQDKKYSQVDTSKFDKYDVESALHFSNAGGVYKVNYDTKNFVMKEGRKEAGLDRLNRDGFQRLKNEAEVLHNLQKKDYVVNMYDYFEIWENNYLVEDYLQGRNLSYFVAEDFPFSNFQDKLKYTGQALKIILRLKDILVDLHKDGFTFGDLQPNNVMILDNHDIKLIDLETSTPTNKVYYPGLQTPGFVLQSARSFEEADWFALWRIARFLFLPIEPISDLTASIEKNQDISIEENFGSAISNQLKSLQTFIESFVQFPESASGLSAPSYQFKNNIKDTLTFQLRQGLIENIDSTSDSLIPGDIRQYTDVFGSLSVAYGGFGAVMALNRTGDLPQEARTWAVGTANRIINMSDPDLPKGMFNGLSGIAEVLFEIGEKKLSKMIFQKCLSEKDNGDLSLFSGVSGVGLISLSLYEQSGDESLLQAAVLAGKEITNKYNQNIKLVSSDPFGIPNGILGGWSGIALFMLELSLLSGNEEFKKTAIQMIRRELENNVSVDEELHLAQVSDYSLGKERLIPYLGEGSAGIALTLFEFNKIAQSFNSAADQKLIENLCNVDETYCSYSSGITRGIAGFIILENAKKELGLIDDYNLSTLRNYLMTYKDHTIISPGNYGYRCSMDLFTGNSGLILTLSDLDTGSWNGWLPIIPGSLSNLFGENKES